MEERDKDRRGLRKPREEQGRRQEGEGNQQAKCQGRTEEIGRGATDHRNETDDRRPDDEPKPRGTCGPPKKMKWNNQAMRAPKEIAG